MIDNGYIFAKDNKRIFLNNSLGCTGMCSYCYLPKFGYNNGEIKSKILSAMELIKLLDNSTIKINKDTIITLGCYSECWDDYNKNETIKLIKYFLKKGNQVQLSTKRKIKKQELKEIVPLIQYYGQLIIFISTATISEHNIYEKNTTPIAERFKSFELLSDLNIPIVLYIKPVLEDVTINDLELYKEYILKYGIKDVVVGSIFTSKKSNESISFSMNNELFYTKNKDEDIIALELKKVANVYRRSTEVMKKYKRS